MAYNNGFPVGYGQIYPGMASFQPQMMPQQQPDPTGPIWVQGEAGAKSFLVGAGKTVPLWDSEAQVIYMKSADASGMPSMKVLDYTVRENPGIPSKAPVISGAEYATKNEVDDIKNKMEKVKDNLTHEIETIKESLGIE